MKRIKLSQGKYAIVDDEDFERLNRYKWFTQRSGNTFYAVRNSPIEKGRQRTISMHREILALRFGDPRQVDHRNHHGLDNRRDNLRICTHRQNMQNMNPHKNGSSAFKGVCWNKEAQKWVASIRVNGKPNYLGYFVSEKEAAKAYDEAAAELFGDYARVNKVA
jgi:hypothetical protein